MELVKHVLSHIVDFEADSKRFHVRILITYTSDSRLIRSMDSCMHVSKTVLLR